MGDRVAGECGYRHILRHVLRLHPGEQLAAWSSRTSRHAVKLLLLSARCVRLVPTRPDKGPGGRALRSSTHLCRPNGDPAPDPVVPPSALFDTGVTQANAGQPKESEVEG